jgi:hypothetical protein
MSSNIMILTIITNNIIINSNISSNKMYFMVYKV